MVRNFIPHLRNVPLFGYSSYAVGFLHVDDEVIPGNFGMKDQVAALRWIRNNIALFGGDFNQVTIAGSSAGGASVHWHMYSSLSKGNWPIF